LHVDCPGGFTVHKGDLRPKLIDANGQAVFNEGWRKVAKEIRIMQEPLKQIVYKTGSNQTVMFDSHYIKVLCHANDVVNIRTKYMPQSGHPMPKPRDAAAGRVLDVVHLKIDALSRAGFFRFNPKSAALIEKLWGGGKERYRSFIFNRYISEAMSTITNMVPMLGGTQTKSFHNTQVKKDWDINLLSIDEQQKPQWVWQQAHDNGFLTLKDQNIMLNHVFSRSFSSFSYHKQMDWSTKQLLKEKETMVKDGDIRLSDCLGDEHFQEHYKRETMQFLDSAPGVPKLVLADSKQAHNKWPYASQYDEQLFALLTELMARKDDLVILLVADHGYGFSDRWQRDINKYPGSDFERLLPFMGILLPQSLLTARPDVERNMHANQQRAVSHYDVHLTLLNLLNAGPFKQPSATTQRIPGMVGTALDLLSTEVPTTRTCDEMGISTKSCVCNSWTTLSVASAKATHAAAIGIKYINAQREKPPGACLVVKLEEVLSAEEKQPVSIGYNNKPGQDSKMGYNVRVEFTGTANTQWRVVLEKNEITELQVMHRYAPLESCWDGSAPLKYCACQL